MSDLRQGALVRFAHERDGGPVHKIVSVMPDGMVEINDMGGYFAPHLFEVADDIGGIPLDPDPPIDGSRVRYFSSTAGGGGVEIEDDSGDACTIYLNNSLARQDILREAAKELRRLADDLDGYPEMVLMPRSDRDDLDAVVKILGIEDSHTTPAEAVQELLNEIESLREEATRKERNIKRAMVEFPDVADLLADMKPHGLTICGMCGTWRRSPCGEGCGWSIRHDSNFGFTSAS
jgi:hypothetical protein